MMRIGRIAGLGIGYLSIGCLMFTFVYQPKPLLIWNATASAPIGLYRLAHEPISPGDLVLVTTPLSIRAMAAERGYLPLNVPLIKRVAALSGDEICAERDVLFINGGAVAQRFTTDSLGRSMPAWSGCHVLADEVFALMTDVPASFDGRYFGPVPRAAIVGTLIPIWTGEAETNP
jgi:conjugative transfer signal peptidase TraF